MAISADELRRLPAAARLTLGRFGGQASPATRLVSIATTRTVLFPGNANRVYAYAQNRAVGNGAVDFDPALTYANGARVGPDGGFIELDPNKVGELVGWEWYAIMEAAAGNWRVWEVIVTS